MSRRSSERSSRRPSRSHSRDRKYQDNLYEMPGDLLRALSQSGVTGENAISFVLETLVQSPAVAEAVLSRRDSQYRTEQEDCSLLKKPRSSCENIGQASSDELFPEVVLGDSDVESSVSEAKDDYELFPEIHIDSDDETLSQDSAELFHEQFASRRPKDSFNLRVPQGEDVIISVEPDAKTSQVTPVRIADILSTPDSNLAAMGLICGLITASLFMGEILQSSLNFEISFHQYC